jgi:hypothetical protein
MAPSLLLVTHALLWWLVETEKLSSLAHAAIQDPAAPVFVSAANGWDLATKVRQGNLPDGEGPLHGLELVVHAHLSQWKINRHKSISWGIGRHRLCSHGICIALLCSALPLWFILGLDGLQSIKLDYA